MKAIHALYMYAVSGRVDPKRKKEVICALQRMKRILPYSSKRFLSGVLYIYELRYVQILLGERMRRNIWWNEAFMKYINCALSINEFRPTHDLRQYSTH
jgi:hypothetical protein